MPHGMAMTLSLAGSAQMLPAWAMVMHALSSAGGMEGFTRIVFSVVGVVPSDGMGQDAWTGNAAQKPMP